MIEFIDTEYTGDSDYNWQDEEGQDGQMETFTPHVTRVKKLALENNKKVWTIMDAESFDGMIITAGYHFVNRVMYFISNEEWKDADETYIWFKSEFEKEDAA